MSDERTPSPVVSVEPAPSPFSAPYAAAPRGSFVVAPPRRSAAVGIIALIAAVLAAFGATVVGAVASFQIGLGTDAASFASVQTPNGLDFLTPVREWVLLGEVSFWIGTGLGVWAIVQGVIAIVTGRGRIAAIVAVVLAALGPVIFFAACGVSLGLGLDAVAASGGAG